MGYYAQSAKGHLELIKQQKPITQWLNDPKVSPQRKKTLILVQEIRQFAHERLKLPNNASYTQFAQLQRKAVTWNLVITPKYSILPAQWCFPLIGCISYKGYFSKTRALKEAAKFAKRPYDIYIAPSSAYSTLGWFHDPVVSPMLDQGIVITAETIFHELAHQQVYHKSDSNFNEAFATAVGQAGTRLWLAEKHPRNLTAYNNYLHKQGQFIQLLLNTIHDLDTFYRSKQSPQNYAIGKQQRLQQLKQGYQVLKRSWQSDSRYDSFFDKPINNARLVLTGIYYQYVPNFAKKLQQHHFNFEVFYQEMNRLKTYSKQERKQYWLLQK
jgi:predicted aminopeptidase